MNKRFLLIILFILLAYVAVTACLGFDINKKARAYVAGRMSQVLYMDVFPERIRFGLINNITIDNLHICRSDSRFIFSGIFDKVIIKYRFRDLILGRFDSPRIVAINRGSLRWHDQATGITIKKDNVYGSAGSFDIKGYEVRLVSGQSYLRGKVNPSKDTFDLDLNFSSMFYSSGQVLEDSQNIKQSKDFFLNVNGRLTKQISQAAGCDLFFEAENEYLTVAFNLKGNLQKSRIKGRFNLLNRVIRPFRGELSIGRTIVLSLDDGSEDPQLRLSAKLLKPDFELGIKLNHFNFKALDIITRLDLSG
ncbi:MAG: hypothetical protein U9R31_03040, partial [Candidatus Omnitrophota bacterium]|nr:hypothetical protein [Candidatus Omnitrophota bacterium]